jgi:hypothetical protein
MPEPGCNKTNYYINKQSYNSLICFTVHGLYFLLLLNIIPAILLYPLSDIPPKDGCILSPVGGLPYFPPPGMKPANTPGNKTKISQRGRVFFSFR